MRTIFLPLGLAATLLCPSLAQAQPAPSPHAEAAPAAWPAPPLTLDQAQALAAERSPLLSAAQREVQAAEAAVQQAGALPNPTLNTQLEDTRRATRTTTATLDFPLELGGKRPARQAAAERARELALAQLAQSGAQLRATVIGAYFNVLVAQERLALSHGSAEVAARSADAIGKRVAAGKASPIDATRARVDQASAQLEVTEAEAEWQASRQALAALWGDEAPGFDRVSGDIGELPLRGPLAELAARLDDAPALAVSRSAAAQQRALVDVARSQAVPDLTLSVGAKRDNEAGRTQAVIGLSVPLPFFDRRQGAIAEAGHRAQKAEDEHRATRLQVLGELQAAARQLALARTSAQSLQTTVLPAAQQAHEAATKAFDAGKLGFLDVIDAQRSLIQARARYLTTLSGAYQAAATIDRLLGR